MSSVLTVPRDEFKERCSRAGQLAAGEGLAGLLIWSRGGGPVDGGADLLYLTDHYPAFPTIPDLPQRWAGRGYSAAIVTSEGEVTLVVDGEGYANEVAADRIVATDDLVATIAEAVRTAFPDQPVGLVAGASMSAPQLGRFQELLPHLELRAADAIVGQLRRIKSPTEQRLARASCAVGAAAMKATIAAVEAGKTEAQVVAEAASIIVANGGVPYNLFVDTWGPARPLARRRLPTWLSEHPLREGDTFAVDMSGAVKGYIFDFARSVVVRGAGSETPLQCAARQTVEAVVEALRPGNTIGHAVRLGFQVLSDSGFADAGTSFEALGHGLGLGWEEPWLLPDVDDFVEPGMVIAVERDMWIGDDGAAYENDVLITEGGPEVLTVV